jgi:autotransporter-associated beta strand protein/T5SS/PEP-CTERM-associated repeat protein
LKAYLVACDSVENHGPPKLMENPYSLPFAKRSRLLRHAGTAALLLGASLSAASAADVTFTGTGLGANWFTPGNWSTGALPTTTGTATLTPGRDVLLGTGTSTVDTLVISGNSNLSVTGSTSRLNTGSFSPAGNIQVRTGTLSVSNRALVTGTFGDINIGQGGTGTVLINTGGTLATGAANFGIGTNDVGVATVSGTNSTWIANGLNIGMAGTGTLAITNGGTVLASGWNSVGAGVGGRGTLVISGTGSTWDSMGNTIFIGAGTNSVGTLLVENGARIGSDFPGIMVLGDVEGSTGVVLQTGGTVTASGLYIGSGTGTYRLEGGVLDVAEFREYSPGVGSYTLELAGGTIRSFNGNPLEGRFNATLRQGTVSSIDITNTGAFATGTWTGVISGSGALNKTGAGTLIITESNTYSGGTTLTQGGLLFGHNNALGSGTLAISGNTSFGATGAARTIANNIALGTGFTGTAAGSANLVLNGTISGAGSLRKTTTGTLTLGGNNTYSGSTNLSAGTILFGHDNALGSGTLAITGNSSIGSTGATRTIANSVTLGSTFTGTVIGTTNLVLNGTISGAGAFHKAGTGTLTLASANSYTGITTVSAGALQINNANALVSSSTLVFAGGTMQGNGTAYSFSNSLSFTGNAGFSGSSNLTYSGNGTLGTAVRTLSVSNTGTTTFAGTLIGAGGGITKNGLGTLLLSGTNNSFTGKTTVSSGTLVVASLSNAGANSSLGAATAANSIIDIGATGTSAALKYIGGSTTSNRVINQAGSTGGATLDASGSGPLVLTGSVTSAAGSKTLTLTGTSTSLNTISGTIGNGSTGVVSLEKSGDGTWALSAANLYSGSTTISGGKLSIAASNNLGAATSAVVLGGASTSGTLAYTGNTASFTRGFTVNAGGGGVETATAGQTLTLSTGTITTAGRFTVSGSGNTAITSTISGTGSLQKSGSGRLAVSGSNSYTGGTTVTSGTLSVQHNNALGTGAVNVGGGTLAVESGFGISNSVVLSGGTYLRTLNGSLINAVNATSDLDGGVDTTARIAAGATATPLTLTTSFSATSVATNDEIRRSDIYAFAGTDDGLFVLELSFTSTADGSYLGWLDGDEWVNATAGNTGNNATGDMLNYQGTFAEFQLEYGNTLGSYVGAYGVDISGGVTTTWAVLNHNSDFSVVPEPGTVVLFATGFAALALRRRRR